MPREETMAVNLLVGYDIFACRNETSLAANVLVCEKGEESSSLPGTIE